MHSSYWEKEHLFSNIDLLVVGSGLTGLQTAIEFKERNSSANVVVVDRASWSQGASLKNAGFACFANLGELLDDLEHTSEDEVFQTVKERYLGLDLLRKNYGDSAIAYEACGSQELFFQNNKNDLYKCIDALQGINSLLTELLNLDRVFTYNSKSDHQSAIGMISNSFEGKLNSSKLYNAILNGASSMGIRVLGGMELNSWEAGTPNIAHFTNGSSIKCNTLVLCTNGFSSVLIDIDIEPARGQIIVTETLDDLNLSSTYMHDKGYYYWRMIDGRVMLGGARNLDKEGERTSEFGQNDIILNELKSFMFEHITRKEVKIEHQWSGIMGMGKSKKPHVKMLEANVYIAAGLGGMGVALSSRVAQEVCKLILD